MKIEESDKLVIITLKEKNLQGFITSLRQEITNGSCENKNVIVDLLSLTDLKLIDLSLFQDLSDTCYNKKCSFVLVNDAVNHNEISSTIHVTPTLQEAKDIIEMEEIERDLGF